jgi:hypothetical protein
MRFPATDIEFAMQDEIEALRTEYERLKTQETIELRARQVLLAENERLTARAEKAEGYMDQFAAESNRLREALEKIIRGCENAPDYSPADCSARIARAALQSKGE